MRSLVTFLLAVLLAGCTLPFAAAPTPTATPTPSPRPTRTPRPAMGVTPSPTRTPRPSSAAIPKPTTAAVSDSSMPMPPSFGGFNPERAAAAPLLNVGSSRTVRLDQTGEAWFRINVQAGQVYELFTANLSDNLDTVLTVFTEYGDEVAYNDDFEGAESRIIYLPNESTTLFVQVRSFAAPAAGASCQLHLRTIALPPADAFDPDDTQEQAKPIALNEVQARTFTYAGDVDWVRFEAKAGQVYFFRTFDLGEGADTILELYDRRGFILAYNDDTVEGLDSAIVYASDVNETWYLKVSSYAVPRLDMPYRLTVTLFNPAPLDAYEPDNELAAARPIPMGDIQYRTITDPRDNDWLAIETRAGYAYRVLLQPEGRGADLEMVLVDTAGNELASSSYLDEQNREVVYTADTDATVFVVIRPILLISNDTGYSVQVAAKAAIEPDHFEPDDDVASVGQHVGNPRLLVEGVVQNRTLRSPSEVDIVPVRVLAGEAYHFIAHYHHERMALSLMLFDRNGTDLVSHDMIDIDNGVLLRYLATTNETLYLKVTASSLPWGGARYALEMTRVSAPQPDAYEPDNDRQSARPIAVGETQQRNFLGFGDEDWLRLDGQAGQTYVIETLNLATGVDTVLELFDAQGQLIDSNDDSQGLASRITFRPPRSATYYVRIKNIGSANFGDSYQVRVSVR